MQFYVNIDVATFSSCCTLDLTCKHYYNIIYFLANINYNHLLYQGKCEGQCQRQFHFIQHIINNTSNCTEC